MSRSGYYTRMFKRGIDVLNRAAEDVAALEEHPITITLPPRPGVGAVTYEVSAYFDENPAPQSLTNLGIKAALNGILYIRETQVPFDLRRSVHDGSIPVGYKFTVRGREYRCTKASFARGEYAFMLNDLLEADHG